MSDFLNINAKTDYGYKADLLNFSQSGITGIPSIIKDEIPTLNRYGFMKTSLDKYSQMFVDRSQEVEYSIDIGCAYGLVVHHALRNNNKIIAVDKEIEHLKILGSNTEQQYRSNLYIIQSSFPHYFQVPENTVGSVLASRIMHFLNKEEFILGLKKIYKILTKDGRFYFTSVSPYHVAIKDGFLAQYKERRKLGNKFPGELKDHWEINPKHIDFSPNFLHVFDIHELEQLMPQYGFYIEDICLFDYPNDTDSQGCGHIGFVARKI